MRWAVTVLAVVGLLTQVWIHVDWIDGLGEHCDYPDECITWWLPRAFAAAEAAWIVTVLAGGIAFACAAWLHESSASLMTLGLALGHLVPGLQLHPAVAP